MEVKDFAKLVGKAMKIEANLKRQVVVDECNKRPPPLGFQSWKGQGPSNKGDLLIRWDKVARVILVYRINKEELLEFASNVENFI